MNWKRAAVGVFLALVSCSSEESQDPCEDAASRSLCFQELFAETVAEYQQAETETSASDFTRRLRSGEFGVDSIEQASTWSGFDACLRSRTNRSICSYQFAASVPCFGPPDDIASLVGIFSPSARTAIQLDEGDYDAAVIDLACEMRKFVLEESHDEFDPVDDLNSRLSKLEALADSDASRDWLRSAEGVEFLDQIWALRNSKISSVSSIPAKFCRIPWLKLRLPC